MIHAPADFQLGVRGGQGRADGLPRPEIEGRSLHREQLAGRDQKVVHRGNGVGVDGQRGIQHGRRRHSR